MRDFHTDANIRETVSSHYLIIDGQRVPLTDELQKLYNKEINDARNRARREHRCANPNYRSCHGDCTLCRFHVQGIILSTDDERYTAGFASGVNALVNAVRTPEEIYCTTEAVRDLYAAAARVVKNGDRILHMTCVESSPPMRSRALSPCPSVLPTIAKRRSSITSKPTGTILWTGSRKSKNIRRIAKNHRKS